MNQIASKYNLTTPPEKTHQQRQQVNTQILQIVILAAQKTRDRARCLLCVFV
jgi:hypothetical protein